MDDADELSVCRGAIQRRGQLPCPERTREQAEYFNVTLDDALKGGATARDTVKELLSKSFGVRTRWAHAMGRGREQRFYGLVEVDGKDLGEILVRRGLARVIGVAVQLPGGEKAKEVKERLRTLENDARQKRAGIWAGSRNTKANPGKK